MTQLWSRLRERTLAWLKPEEEGGGAFGPFEAGVILVGCLGLAVMQYGGTEMTFLRWFGEDLATAARSTALPESIGSKYARAADHPFYNLLSLAHWVAFCVVGYVLIPAAYLLLTKRRVRDCNLEFAGFFQHVKLYLALFAVMVPIVVWASTWQSHHSIYPFYRDSGRSWADLIAWQGLYFVQFCALEFYFRGFLLEGLRRWVGYAAVFVMLFPYCMIHFFGKTFPESMASLVAGVVLGTLAMKYRSIWGGALLHWFIAGSMDWLVLWQRGKLPTRLWWP